MNISIEVSNLVSDDNMGFMMAIGMSIEKVPANKKDRVLKDLTKNGFYAQLPGTKVAEHIGQGKVKTVNFVLSEVGVIAEQQRMWVEQVFGGLVYELATVNRDEIPVDSLLVHSDRNVLIKHGVDGGAVLPVSKLESQLDFILSHLK